MRIVFKMEIHLVVLLKFELRHVRNKPEVSKLSFLTLKINIC